MSKNRVDYIDVAKGLGICLVIWGHLFTYGSQISSIIFSFHMPLFFFLSGMVYNPNKNTCFKECLKRKVRSVLVPYIVFLCIGLGITLIIPTWRKELNIDVLKQQLLIGAPEALHVGQVWFLICLFEVELVFYFFHKYVIKNNRFMTVCILLFTIWLANNISIVWPHCYAGRLPLKLDSMIMAFSFYSIGFLLKDIFNDKDFVKKNIILIIPLLYFVLHSYTNGWVNIAICAYNNLYYYLFFSLLGTFVIIYISQVLKKSKLLSYIGRNSLVIFSLHSFGLCLFTYILSRKYGTLIINGNNVSDKDALIGGFFVLACMLMCTVIWNGFKNVFIAKKE